MYWSARTYSKYSVMVGLPTVGDYVAAAASKGHPALAITDKGMTNSAVDLYRACRKHGINPVPGVEFPVAFTVDNLKSGLANLPMLATTLTGYRNLTALTRVAYLKNRIGILDLADLAEAAESGGLDGIACLSGPTIGGFLHTALQRTQKPKTILNLAKCLDSWFGEGLWMELSPEGAYMPDKRAEVLALSESLARTIGLPMVVTTGPRYLTPDDRYAWSTLNDINKGTAEHVEKLFVGHLPSAEEIEPAFTKSQWDEGIAGLIELHKLASVTIPELDEFKVFVPDVSMPLDPDVDLMNKVTAAMQARIDSKGVPAKDAEKYWHRLNEEMEVVVEASFSGYLLFTAVVVKWIRDKEILYNIRGSASASLLCWLLDITSLDPIKWELRFDRFLSKDRSKPPDVDIDVDSERHHEIIGWLSQAFPTLRIVTWSTGRAAREEGKELSGALVRAYKAMLRRTGQDPKLPLSDEEEARLLRLSDSEPYVGVGVGAAGVLVAPDEAVINTAPVYRIDSSNTVVTALDKEVVESLGYVKLDVLGLKALAALQMIQDATGITWDDVQWDDEATYATIAKGATGGLFQLDGKTFRSGVKKLKPKKFADIVASMALFRPAAMKSGGTESYLARRFRREPIPKRHPIIDKHIKDTYGVLLYQEQAIGLLRDLGLDIEDIEDARKAIKASNNHVADAEIRMRRVMEKAMKLGREAGLGLDDLTWLDSAMRAYAEYGFNMSHAVSYARIAYITAWYKTHYPLQYWVAFLTIHCKTDHEKEYLKEMRESGIVVRSAHINKSGINYTIDPDGKSIRKPLASIKGVGEKAAAELAKHAPYEFLDDIAERVSTAVTGVKGLREKHSPGSCPGDIAALSKAGALGDLTWRSEK